MHLKIVFIGIEEKIDFDKGMLEEVEGEYKKLYYKMKDDVVELLFFNEHYYRICDFINKATIVVINKTNDLRAEEIESIKNNKNILVIFGEKDNKLVNFENEFIFAEILNSKKIEMHDIVLTIYSIFEHNSIINNTSGLNGIIGYTETKYLQQNILTNILNQFEIIEKCNEYSLNLLLEEKLNIDELAYIEDPIKEYTYKNSNFKISQSINEVCKDKIYFSIIGM